MIIPAGRYRSSSPSIRKSGCRLLVEPLRRTVVGTRTILVIEALLSKRSPTDPNAEELSLPFFPVIEFEIVEPASERIKVKAICRHTGLRRYFIDLLDEIADLWPETHDAISECKIAALTPEQRKELINSVVSKVKQEQLTTTSADSGLSEKKRGWKHERAITFYGTLVDLETACKNRSELRASQGWQRLYIEPTGIVLALPNDEGITCYDQLDGTARCIVMTDNDEWWQHAKALLDELSESKGDERQSKADLPDSIKPPKGKKRERWIKAYAIICETRTKFQEAYDNLETDTPSPNAGDYEDALKENGVSYSDRTITAIINWGDAGQLSAT